MIKALLIGHLGKDAEVNTVNGKTVINFNVAHSEKYKDQQNVQHETTLWVQCSWWTDRTAIAPYLKKGTQVYVEGYPNVKAYERNGGDCAAQMTLRVISVQLLGSGQKAAGSQQSAPSDMPPASGDSGDATDDLPF